MEITKRKKYLEKQKLNEFFIKLESEKNPKKNKCLLNNNWIVSRISYKKTVRNNL